MTDMVDEIAREVKDNKVVVYMKGTPSFPMCGFSAATVQVLREVGVPFKAIDVLAEPEKREAIKRFSNWPTIPQVYVGGKFIGGCDIVREMHARGELAPLLRAAESARRRGILVLISDLYEDPDTALRAARALQHKGSDLIVFQVLDPAELDFPYEVAANYEDLETGEKMPIVPEYVRAQYRRLVQQHVDTLARLFGENRIDHALLDTKTPLDHALFRYLSRRERLTR